MRDGETGLLGVEYRNASNKHPGAYLIFEAPGWALIHGRHLIEGALI